MVTKSSSTSSSKPATRREAPTTTFEAEPLTSSIAKTAPEAVHFILLQVGDWLQNRLGRCLREYELTLSQYHVLRILEHAGATLPALEIATRMPQVVPAITGLLTRLDEQGLVRRKQDKQDKRVTQVELTTKARSLLKKLEKPVLDLHLDMHKELAHSLTDAESKQLGRLLEKMAQGLVQN